MKYIISILLLTAQVAFANGYSTGVPMPPVLIQGPVNVNQTPVPVTFSASSGLPVTQASFPWIVFVTNTPNVIVTNSPFVQQGTVPWVTTGVITNTPNVIVPGGVAITNSPFVQQGSIPWIVTAAVTNSPNVIVPQGVAITNTPTVMITGTVSTTIGPNKNASQSTVAVTVAESNYAAPANAVGVIIEAESSNASNIRWGASNSAVNILSTTVGVLQEPGRDSGYVPLGQGTYLHLISVAAGTNNIDIQWVLSQ